MDNANILEISNRKRLSSDDKALLVSAIEQQALSIIETKGRDESVTAAGHKISIREYVGLGFSIVHIPAFRDDPSGQSFPEAVMIQFNEKSVFDRQSHRETRLVRGQWISELFKI